MLGKFVSWGLFVLTIALLILVVRRMRGLKRVFLSICLCAMLVCVCILNNYPIDGLLLTFSTPEAVSDYVCPQSLIGFAEGKSSCLIMYSTSDASTTTMIAPKTETGYRVGGFGSDIVLHSTRANGCSITLKGSRRCSDQYIVLTGFVAGSNIAIEDSIESEFTIITQPMPKLFHAEQFDTMIWAFAYLDNFDVETYELTIVDGFGASTAKFDDS